MHQIVKKPYYICNKNTKTYGNKLFGKKREKEWNKLNIGDEIDIIPISPSAKALAEISDRFIDIPYSGSSEVNTSEDPDLKKMLEDSAKLSEEEFYRLHEGQDFRIASYTSPEERYVIEKI